MRFVRESTATVESHTQVHLRTDLTAMTAPVAGIGEPDVATNGRGPVAAAPLTSPTSAGVDRGPMLLVPTDC
jgi:hypothetical protein